MAIHELGSDHAGLRDALARAEGALLAMEAGVASRDRATKYTPRHLRPIRMAWDAYAEALADHLDAEERMVHPAIRHLLGGKVKMASAVTASVAQMMQAHEELDDLARQLRLTLSYCPPVAAPMERVLERSSAHAHLEDAQLYPLALKTANGQFDLAETPVPHRQRSIHDLDRALRTPSRPDQRHNAPDAEAPGEKKKGGWLSRLVRNRR